MATPVKLPELGEGVTEGELIKWLVKIGDSVKPDQPVAEVMTDKATVEVPSPVAGVVKEFLFKAGDTILVDKVILNLEAATTSSASPAQPQKTMPPPNKASAQAATSGTPHATSVAPQAAPAVIDGAAMTASAASSYLPPTDFHVLATPSTRRLAREMGVDINEVAGSGLAGRVTREDVVTRFSGATLASGATGPSTSTSISLPSLSSSAEERVPLRGIRKKIAENLQMAKRIIPHFTLMEEAEVTELVKFREGMKEAAEKMGTKVTYLPLVMKALIATCRQYPMFNASIDDQAQEIVYKKHFNLGFAADTPNGLVVPVIKNADFKSILNLSQEISDLSKRARDGKLKSEEMKGASITITNIGSVGGTYATPIINHPEVAILGMYKIQDRLVMNDDGSLAKIKVMNFTITADHRLIDGAVAANFLKDFVARLQNPGRLMLEMI